MRLLEELDLPQMYLQYLYISFNFFLSTSIHEVCNKIFRRVVEEVSPITTP